MPKFRRYDEEDEANEQQTEIEGSLYRYPSESSSSEEPNNRREKRALKHEPQNNAQLLRETKHTIARLRTLMHVSNTLVLLFSILVIVLYFTTPWFDGVKLQQKRLECKRAEGSFVAFEDCYGVCHDDAESKDCRPLHELLDPTHTGTLEGACNSEGMSSKGGRKGCGSKCGISECCWSREDGGNCSEEYEDMCRIFLPCAVYYVDPESFGMGVGPVIIAGTGVDGAVNP